MGLDPIYLTMLAIPALIVILTLALRRDTDLATRAAWGVGAIGAICALVSLAGDHGQTAAMFLLSSAVAFGLLAGRVRG